MSSGITININNRYMTGETSDIPKYTYLIDLCQKPFDQRLGIDNAGHVYQELNQEHAQCSQQLRREFQAATRVWEENKRKSPGRIVLTSITVSGAVLLGSFIGGPLVVWGIGSIVFGGLGGVIASEVPAKRYLYKLGAIFQREIDFVNSKMEYLTGKIEELNENSQERRQLVKLKKHFEWIKPRPFWSRLADEMIRTQPQRAAMLEFYKKDMEEMRRESQKRHDRFMDHL